MRKEPGAPRGRGEPKQLGEVQPELRLFGQLVVEFQREHGVNAAELARRTGIEYTHLKKLCTPEKYGYTGLSMDIVRKVRNTLQISADYFLQDIDTARPALPLYSLDKKRQEVWTTKVDERLHETQQAIHDIRAEMSELRTELHRERAANDQLRRENEQLREAARTRRSK